MTRDEKIIRDYKAGLSLAKIAEKLTIGRQRVYQILKKNGVKLRNQRDTVSVQRVNIDREILKDLYCNKKLNKLEIAAHLKCSTFSVMRYLKKYELSRSREDDLISRRTLAGTKELTKDRLTDLLNSGMTQQEISDIFGTSQSNVSRLIRAYKIGGGYEVRGRERVGSNESKEAGIS